MAQYGSDSQPLDMLVESADLYCDPLSISEFEAEAEEVEPRQPSSPPDSDDEVPQDLRRGDATVGFAAPSPIVTHKRVAEKAMKSVKSPLKHRNCWEESDHPDLADYFDDFDTPNASRIRICRTYASYLDAQTPKKRKVVKKKSNK